MRALALTYHAVGDGPRPLCLDVETFERQADVLARSGAVALTATGLGRALASADPPESAVVVTFDDGIAGIADRAAPVLRAHGILATVFCVSRRLGGQNDWPSQPSWAPRLPLASAGELRELVAHGWEVGAHGTQHDRLDALEDDRLAGELRASRDELEQAIGVDVRAFAFPYGIVGGADGEALATAGYASAWTTRPGWCRPGADPFSLPRVDAHYLRSPRLLEHLLAGRAPGYLALRRAAGAMRRSLSGRA